MKGSLVYEDYLDLVKSKKITSSTFELNQIQPSSIDLSLSDECYEIKYSFLSPNSTVRKKLENLTLKRIDLNQEYLFEINKTYLVKLNEKLSLDNNTFGHCNPKSSTGRLDIFCRTIVDYADEYEKIPSNYSGDVFLEITSRSFDIMFKKGDKLNQLRLNSNEHVYLSDSEIKDLDLKYKIIDETKEKEKNNIDNGLKVSIDLSNDKNIAAYSAKENSPILFFDKINFHNIDDFWNPIYPENNSIIIEKNKFYILRSKEKVKIPTIVAGEMVPYDTGIGDFRAHYAGFFDPGFGVPNGSYAVLEVKTNELPFLIENGQTIARIKYERLNKTSKVIYGKNINSNYQNQGLTLSKHFTNL